MTIDPQTRRLGYGLGLGLPALALAFAALAQRPAGPVCAEVPDEVAMPGLTVLDAPAPYRPACIRVPLIAVR
jgi:hypothetical protein